MRHILPAQPVTAASFGMLEAASSALLVAVAGFLDGSAACDLCAASGAIDLAPVAAAAQHLGTGNEKSVIGFSGDIGIDRRLPETRPAAAGFELFR